MAREPFSSNADGNGFSGVSGYNASDARSPALGRSSRDLASDTGPGAASEGLFSTPDIDTGTLTGAGREKTTDDAIRRDRKANRDADPDARLGLRPTTAGTVAPRQPAYPETSPRDRAVMGALAGLIGGSVAAAAWYAVHWAGAAPVPPSLAAARTLMGQGAVSTTLGMLASIGAGAVWGALFGLLVKKPTILKGMVFGVLPALFQWTVLALLSRQPMFFGATAAAIALPLLFCVFVWGGLTGYHSGRWLRPPYSAAVDPDLTTAAT